MNCNTTHYRANSSSVPGDPTGDALLERLDLSDGSIEWTQPIVLPGDSDMLAGMASVCGERVLVPLETSLLVCDTGPSGLVERRPWPKRPYPVRRVQIADAVLLATDNDSLFAAVDVERALADLAARAGSSPEALLRFSELSLSAGRVAEAEAGFEALLESEAGDFRERAVAGRLKASLYGARQQDDVAHWAALLEVGRRLGDVWSVAPEALVALDALGATDSVDEWLAVLADQDAERRIDLGRLTPQGSQPAGLALALSRLSRDPPAQAVARLQELLVRWPDESWDGRPVREQAARHIGELLEAHGHALYASFDRQAELELEAAGDEAAVAAVTERFPHARVVEQARLQHYETLLASGGAQALLEELATVAGSPGGATLAELRARAARQLGEIALADALEGRPPAPSSSTLPALPGADAQVFNVEVSSGGAVDFPDVDGLVDPPFAAMALGTVSGSGELFLLDTVAGAVAWRRPMPGQVSYPTPKDADFLRAGERVYVEVSAVRTRPDRPPGEVLEAVSLGDGSTLWSRLLTGSKRDTLLAAGLVLRLTLERQGGARQFRLDGYGQVTGAHVLSLDLPNCQTARLHRAGAHVLVWTVGNILNDGTPQDVRLWTLDPAAGVLRPNPALPASSPWVVTTLDEPPCVLLAQRQVAPASGAWLGGWDPVTRAMAWSVDVPTEDIDQRTLLPASASRAVLVSRTRVASGPEPVQLLAIDARQGLLPTIEAGAGLELLAGQDEGRAPLLVLLDSVDDSRLVVADGSSGQLRFELRLPPPGPGSAARRTPLDELAVVHGRDAFVLANLPIASDAPTTLRIVDSDSGRERYSVVLDGSSQAGRSDLVAVEGAVLLAKGGSVRVIRSPTR